VDVVAWNGERAVWEGEVDCMIVEEVLEGGEGPLVGILSGLLWAESEGKEWLVTVPLDTPFLPSDIVLRLVRGAQEGGAGVSCARSGRYHHPVVGCWHVGGWLGRVRGALERGVRKIDRVFEEGERVSVDVEMVFFGEGFCYDPLMNVNDREDLLKAEEIGMRLRGRERG
jgi:molybdopterin-guanine dinucleotide biosynthesis protein A